MVIPWPGALPTFHQPPASSAPLPALGHAGRCQGRVRQGLKLLDAEITIADDGDKQTVHDHRRAAKTGLRRPRNNEHVDAANRDDLARYAIRDLRLIGVFGTAGERPPSYLKTNARAVLDEHLGIPAGPDPHVGDRCVRCKVFLGPNDRKRDRGDGRAERYTGAGCQGRRLSRSP